jgi:hypothetical protein
MPLLSTVAAAALPVVFFLSALAHASAGRAGGETPREREADVRRAEKVLAKLYSLEASAAGAPHSGAFESEVGRLYPGLFAEVASMREGDLKSDLSTAVFLYYDARRTHPASSAAITSAADCEAEPRDFYRRLCLGTRGGTRGELMRAKARAHAAWAAAVVNYLRGGRTRATLAALAEMRAERAVDLALAGRALSALRKLEGGVRAHRTLSEFEEQGGEVAGVPFGELCESVSEALRAVDPLLASLPRGPVRLALQNARNSYRDGLFWWRKTHRRSAPTVAADALAEADPLEATRLDPAAARYTVVINWRSALKYTAQAEDLIRSSGHSDIAAQP